MPRAASRVLLVALLLLTSSLSARQLRPVTVDDLMRLRSVFDVRVSPDGSNVAYVVSTPTMVTNSQEAQIFLVSTHGGASRRLGGDARVYAPALPAARLRWRPAGLE